MEIKTESITAEQFNQNKGWGKSAWNKDEVSEGFLKIAKENKGKFLTIPINKAFWESARKNPSEMVKYPTYFAMLFLKQIAKDSGIKVKMRTTGNKKGELAGGVKCEF